MNPIIFKYPLPLAGPGIVEAPAGATLLASVHVQDRTPVLWFLVDKDEPAKSLWEVYIAVTGEPLPAELRLDEAHYLGTFQLAKHDPWAIGMRHFVGHVFVFVPKGHKIRAVGQAATGG